MNYTDYKATRDLVWRVLLNENVCTLPISVSALCGQMNISVKLYSPTDGNSGTAQVIDGNAVIFVKRDDIPERQRFTAAHELGHILLDREYAVITAINILTALSEPHESSQLPASSCHRGRNGKDQ